MPDRPALGYGSRGLPQHDGFHALEDLRCRDKVVAHVALVDQQDDAHIAQRIDIDIGLESFVCPAMPDVSRLYEPAHPVTLHGIKEPVHTLDGQQLPPLIDSGVVHGHRVMGHVFGSRDDEAGADLVHPVRLALWVYKAKEAAVALRKSFLTGQCRIGIRASHLQRIEYIFLDVVFVAHPAYILNHDRQHVIANIEILMYYADRRGQFCGSQGADGILICCILRQHGCEPGFGKSAHVMQEVIDGDLLRGAIISDPEPGNVVLHRGARIDLPLLDQLGNRQARERLAL